MKSMVRAGIALMACAAFASGLSWAQSSLQTAVTYDQYGGGIGDLPSNGISINQVDASTVQVTLVTRTGDWGVPMSTLAPAPTATPTNVTLRPPISAFVITCPQGRYNRLYGICGGGTAPTKVVQITSATNPTTQYPPACGTGTVPTFLTASGWSCRPPPSVIANSSRRL